MGLGALLGDLSMVDPAPSPGNFTTATPAPTPNPNHNPTTPSPRTQSSSATNTSAAEVSPSALPKRANKAAFSFGAALSDLDPFAALNSP